jgi:hypothetical protein
MATHYQYRDDGKLVGSFVSTTPPGLSYASYPHMPYYGPYNSYWPFPASHPYHEPSLYQANGMHPQQSSYAHPEGARPHHTLLGLLRQINPRWAMNAIQGPRLDIVEQDTSRVLAYAVPKRMLLLFLGRHMVEKFPIRDLKVENHETWRRGSQQWCIPRNKSSRSALKVIVAWMLKASRCPADRMRPMRTPRNLFVACSLAQTLELFGLYKDAYYVDKSISKNLELPIFAADLESLWNCLGEESKYVYAVIKRLGAEIQNYEKLTTEDIMRHEYINTVLQKHPQLSDRVHNLELNEEYRPQFSTEWIRKLTPPTTSSQIELQMASTSDDLVDKSTQTDGDLWYDC